MLIAVSPARYSQLATHSRLRRSARKQAFTHIQGRRARPLNLAFDAYA